MTNMSLNATSEDLKATKIICLNAFIKKIKSDVDK